MKSRFAWYYPLDEKEIKTIWDDAILTVDANVLLDLYRYHEDTRNALLKAVEKFKDRSWLSHQTAEEFFRNRKKVIISSINSYDNAIQNCSDIRTGTEESLVRLKNNRIIPDKTAESLRTVLDKALNSAQESISEAKEKHPNFLESDPILDSLTKIFDGSVGEEFDKDQFSEAMNEGKRRMEAKIPPGFLDSKKDGSRPFGDYFMWRQILEFAAIKKKPIIFVTSEGKEDWWEKSSGKTTGLHYELLKEAYEKTGQRFIAYRTDRFFRFSSEQSGEESNESAAEEISAIVKARSASAPLIQVVSHTESLSSQNKNIGEIAIELLRPAFAFTCSRHFTPNLIDIPNVSARLTITPEGIPQHIVRAGAGTTFDFNVHVKSVAYNEHLPVGIYVFEYEATTSDVLHKDDET